MSRYIDADALIDTLGVSDEEIDFKEILREAPSIDIVRCKECKHRTDSKAKSFCEKWLREVDADDFCSYGQKGVANEKAMEESDSDTN